jgi:hypothetical protein
MLLYALLTNGFFADADRCYSISTPGIVHVLQGNHNVQLYILQEVVTLQVREGPKVRGWSSCGVIFDYLKAIAVF